MRRFHTSWSLSSPASYTRVFNEWKLIAERAHSIHWNEYYYYLQKRLISLQFILEFRQLGNAFLQIFSTLYAKLLSNVILLLGHQINQIRDDDRHSIWQRIECIRSARTRCRHEVSVMFWFCNQFLCHENWCKNLKIVSKLFTIKNSLLSRRSPLVVASQHASWRRLLIDDVVSDKVIVLNHLSAAKFN